MTFKTQAEIFQALLDGKTLVYKTTGEVKLVDGILSPIWAFTDPEDWSIKKEPMVIWAVVSGNTVVQTSNAEFGAKEMAGRIGDCRTVKFIEVEDT